MCKKHNSGAGRPARESGKTIKPLSLATGKKRSTREPKPVGLNDGERDFERNGSKAAPREEGRLNAPTTDCRQAPKRGKIKPLEPS